MNGDSLEYQLGKINEKLDNLQSGLLDISSIVKKDHDDLNRLESRFKTTVAIGSIIFSPPTLIYLVKFIMSISK